MTQWIKGGVTAPKGFSAWGVHAGIKRFKTKDLLLIKSDIPAVTQGVFTCNQMKAACVTYNLDRLKRPQAQAIVANSGNANCMTGRKGMADTRQMARQAARLLGISAEKVLVASTGKIGVLLPMTKIKRALPGLARNLSRQGSHAAAQALLTTDRVVKEDAFVITLGGVKVRVGAIAKGAGMIHPQMTVNGKHATMLCFVTTDACISAPALKKALVLAVERTFNCITIDGDQSTNDMVIVMANGLARNRRIVPQGADFEKFTRSLQVLFEKQAQRLVRDAEGATKFVEVQVRGAVDEKKARQIAFSVAGSNLVKTALFGEDPNWGRIAASVGYAGVPLKPEAVEIRLGGVAVVKAGAGVMLNNRSQLDRIFKRDNIRIDVRVGRGRGEAKVWTCDLSTAYVRINSAYFT